jgi:lipopolysaccharide/colanic/teichoic acid biosynthesis glycosyltransferase
MGCIAFLVWLFSGRPILFIQERVGLLGRPFKLFKFRTMRPHPEDGMGVTGRGDERITSFGRLLRSTKLDELPQLFNVARGEMSLVGPRPEVPRYVARYTEDQKRVLDVRPGLTDPATLEWRHEENLLGRIEVESRERYYLENILPRKLDLNLTYREQAHFLYDIALIARTTKEILLPGGPWSRSS